MWIFIWAVLSAIVLGATLWSYLVLRQQKKAWQAFAKRHTLDYKPGTMMGPPFMSGRVGKYTMAFFTGLQRTTDARGQRYLTVIEVDLKVGMPTAAAVGTKETAPFINALRLEHEYKPEATENWSGDYVLRTRDVHKLKAYLSAERMTALHNLFSMNNVVMLFFFDEQDCILRMETNDPLRDDKKMDKIVARIFSNIDKLMPTDAEKAEAEKERARQYTRQREEEGADSPAPQQPAAAPEPEAGPPLREKPVDNSAAPENLPPAGSRGKKAKKKHEPYLEPREDKTPKE